MSAENEIKCIRCGSSNAYLFVGNKDPDKYGYRCRDCLVSWSRAEAQ